MMEKVNMVDMADMVDMVDMEMVEVTKGMIMEMVEMNYKRKLFLQPKTDMENERKGINMRGLLITLN